ncbi:hypothetical protein C8Q80DRAFT_1265369 [Daedaleopsis nitida]|nr:hypothetical protein C8Q80DRAFT_1265369 [Daedaleopsis nitida]
MDIAIGGYLLNDFDQITQLCILKYRISPQAIKDVGPLDCICYYWSRRSAIQAPSLIPISYQDESDPTKVVDAWILPGRAAFFPKNSTPRSLPLKDKATTYYLLTSVE